MEDVQKDVDVKFIAAEADIEKTGKEIRREVKGEVEMLEEAVVQVRVDMGRWDRRGETEAPTRASPTQDPATPTPTSFPSAALNPPDEPRLFIDPAPRPTSSNSSLSQLESRVTILERRMESQKVRTQTIKSRPMAVSDDIESRLKTDILTEMDQKLSEATAEFHSFRQETVSRLSTLESNHSPVDLTPIIVRLNALEAPKPRPEVQNHVVKHVTKVMPSSAPLSPVSTPVQPGLKDAISDLQTQISSLKAAIDQFPAPFDPEPISQDIFQLKSTNSRLNNDLISLQRAFSELKPPKIDPNPAITDPTIAILTAAGKATQQPLSSKQLLADIGVVLANEKAAFLRHPSFAVVPQQSSEQVAALEARINGIYHEQEKSKGEVAAYGREIEEMNQHFDRLERMLTGMIHRTQGELNQRIDNLESLLDKPVESPEAAKNLSALRGIIAKLQKEQKSMGETVRGMQGEREKQPSKGEGDREEGEERGKTVAGYVQKHEAQLKTVDNSIKQLAHELESVKIHLRRSAESVSTMARLTEMEKFRLEVETVLAKVMEGVKLSKRDYEMLNELYEQMETKGDKAELAQKVDKGELRKAYSSLVKKIEGFKEEVRKVNEAQVPIVVKEEPAAGTVRKLDLGCLSCGHEVSSPDTDRELRHSTPGLVRGIHKYGHGFSKLLPILNDMVTPQHRRNNSEVQPGTTSTERMKRLRVRIPESLPTSVSTRVHTTSSTPLH